MLETIGTVPALREVGVLKGRLIQIASGREMLTDPFTGGPPRDSLVLRVQDDTRHGAEETAK